MVSFQSFFNGWLIRQQMFLDQLLESINPENVEKTEQQTGLIHQVLSHYQQYCEEKSNVATDDVFLLFSPPWLSSFEQTFLWIAGFKPALVFKFVNSAVIGDLTDEQGDKIERLKREIWRKERDLSETLARIQESLAAPPLFNMLRRFGRLIDGEVSDFDSAIEAMKNSMFVLLENADALRVATVKNVVEILNPVQTVRFLAAAAEFQLQVRRWGLTRGSASTSGFSRS